MALNPKEIQSYVDGLDITELEHLQVAINRRHAIASKKATGFYKISGTISIQAELYMPVEYAGDPVAINHYLVDELADLCISNYWKVQFDNIKAETVTCASQKYSPAEETLAQEQT